MDAQTDKTVTYAELQKKIVKCALWLRGKGIKSGDIITVCTSNHLDSIVPCLAAVYLNAILNSWNEDMNLRESAETARSAASDYGREYANRFGNYDLTAFLRDFAIYV